MTGTLLPASVQEPPTPKQPATPRRAPAAPEQSPLAAVLGRLDTARRQDVETALRIYRAHALKLANEKALSDDEVRALSHAMRELGLTAADLEADVAGVAKHRAQLAAMADSQKRVNDIRPQEKGWAAEEERMRNRVNEIRGLRATLHSSELSLAQHEQEADRLVSAHWRVLGDMSAAVARAAAAPQAAGFAGKVIRSGDGGASDGVPLPPDVQRLMAG